MQERANRSRRSSRNFSSEESRKEEKMSTIDSHEGDLEESHKRMREGAKTNGKQKRISEEEYD